MYWVQYLINIALVVVLCLLYQEYRDLLLKKGGYNGYTQDESDFVYKTKVLGTDIQNENVDFSRNSLQLGLRDECMFDIAKSGSSVWCLGANHTTRICKFRNLCYHSVEEKFLFFHGQDTVISGIPADRFDPALLDMSSVADHNTQYFNYVDLPSTKAQEILESYRKINGSSFVFRRFHPENLMHVFHDDLLPLFSTLQMISESHSALKPFDMQLFMADNHPPGSYSDLYQMFSLHEPIYSAELKDASQPPTVAVCFETAHVGMLKDTTWYQYGFYKPQGPIPDHQLTAKRLEHFKRYFLQNFHFDDTSFASQSGFAMETDGYIVLLSRKDNRLILNEMELTLALAQELHRKVIIVSQETHSLGEIVDKIRGASVVIGMHGSLLVLSMFLSHGAVLIECFPYGVSPDYYTPYRTLANLPGSTILYRSWRNMDVANTRTHVNWAPEFGGIAHLPAAQQQEILERTEVPLHLCCSDPEWLFRIFQDTRVSASEVISLVKDALRQHSGVTQTAENSKIYPDHVLNVEFSCNSVVNQESTNHNKVYLNLSSTWGPPWNSKYMAAVPRLSYTILVQKLHDDGFIKSYLTEDTTLSIVEEIDNAQGTYVIWIQAVQDHNIGPFQRNISKCIIEQ